MDNLTEGGRLPIDVRAALKAICTTGKGRCWHCDAGLPKARRAIREGWDVQRIDDYPVASIILVCPACLRGQATEHSAAPARSQKQITFAPLRAGFRNAGLPSAGSE